MSDHAELNGAPLSLDDPGLLRAIGYGHFTSMQVRDGRVRGLDLHLQRLDTSSVELFGRGVPPERSRAYLRAALARAGTGDASIRVNAFNRGTKAVGGTGRGPVGGGGRARGGVGDEAPAEPELLVTVSAPVEASAGPLSLLAIQHERVLPHVKHTGTFDLFHYGRQARSAGHDDAALPVASIQTDGGRTTRYAADPTARALLLKAHDAVPAQPI